MSGCQSVFYIKTFFWLLCKQQSAQKYQKARPPLAEHKAIDTYLKPPSCLQNRVLSKVMKIREPLSKTFLYSSLSLLSTPRSTSVIANIARMTTRSFSLLLLAALAHGQLVPTAFSSNTGACDSPFVTDCLALRARLQGSDNSKFFTTLGHPSILTPTVRCQSSGPRTLEKAGYLPLTA